MQEIYESTIHLRGSNGELIIQDVQVTANSFGTACTLIETLYHPEQYSSPRVKGW